MKKYTIELKVKVWLLGNGCERGIIKLDIYSKNSHNAVLGAIKTLDLDNIKFIKKNTIKYDWENDWQKAFDFEVEEVKSIKVNA